MKRSSIKKRLIALTILGICMFILDSCAQKSMADNDMSGSIDDAYDSVEENSSYGGSFSADDVKNFVFEGEELTIPYDYEVITELGWYVSDEENVEDGEYLPILCMENQQYPGCFLYLNSKYLHNNIYTIDGLVDEFKTNGVWGIDIHYNSDSDECPDFHIKDVGLGDSLEDILNAFGDNYEAAYSEPEDGYYLYQVFREEDGTYVSYLISFSLNDNDEIYEIVSHIFYFYS